MNQTPSIWTLKGPRKVSVFMLFESKKHLLLEQNTQDIKEHISTVKLNISNFHKVVIPWNKSTETLKKRSFM